MEIAVTLYEKSVFMENYVIAQNFHTQRFLPMLLIVKWCLWKCKVLCTTSLCYPKIHYIAVTCVSARIGHRALFGLGMTTSS